jgi:RNA polymerase sigma-70 factor (ECF subfamily)
MARHTAGDPRAFDDLCRALSPRLRRFFERRTSGAEVAADLVQETLLRAFLARDRFVPGADVTPWIFCIARRVGIDRARRAAFESRLLEGYDAEDDATMRSHDALPDELLSSRQLAESVAASLAKLSASHRAAFELVLGDGLSASEVAARLGTTSSAVRLRTHRARQAVRADLAAAA